MRIHYVFLAAVFSFAANASSEADKLLGSNRSKTFDSFVRQIADFETVSEKGLARLNTTWKKELERTKRRFTDAKTREDVYYALLSLQRSYHDAHSWIKADGLSPSNPQVSIPVQFAPMYNGESWDYVVTSSQTPLLKAGQRLISIDGADVPALEKSFTEWSNFSSADTTRYSLARWISKRDPRKSPSPLPETTVKLRVANPDNSTKDVDLTWQKAGPNRPSDPARCGQGDADFDSDYKNFKIEFVGLGYCVYSSKKPGVLIVRYSNFVYWVDEPEIFWNHISDLSYKPQKIREKENPEGLLGRMDQRELVTWLKKKKAKKIYIDFRENGGGTLPLILPAAFASKPVHATAVRLRLGPGYRKNPALLSSMNPMKAKIFKQDLEKDPKAEYSSIVPFFCYGETCEDSDKFLEPTKELANVPVVVISGPNCISACDQYVAILKGNGLAKTAGLPSSGATSPIRTEQTFQLKDGSTFAITLSTSDNVLPNGENLEGNPAPIDLIVYPTVKNSGRYIEEVMSRI